MQHKFRRKQVHTIAAMKYMKQWITQHWKGKHFQSTNSSIQIPPLHSIGRSFNTWKHPGQCLRYRRICRYLAIGIATILASPFLTKFAIMVPTHLHFKVCVYNDHKGLMIFYIMKKSNMMFGK